MVPFIKKFGKSGGLEVLEVKGLANEKSLLGLRDGLVKQGGIFRLYVKSM